jgi:flagellar basal-body rod protein FlgG
MTDVLAIGLHGMQQDMARLERIAMNLANASTPGFKREVASALPLPGGSFVDAMTLSGVAPSRPEGPMSSRFEPFGLMLVRPDMRPGTLRSTGQALDVSLTGPGFFEVGTEGGPAYTRQGNWHLDGRGRLVTAQGDPVMGHSGEIVLNNPNPRIDAKGQVFDATAEARADASPVAQIKVVRFRDDDPLRHLGGGLFEAPNVSPEPLRDADVDVRQGYLENANVNAMREMAQLIQSMRHLESMQKVATGYDEMIGSAVRKLGELG